MNLKEKIVSILDEKKATYASLAKYLGIQEKDLDFALENSTLEIRTLELISKELRIPLYSFFRETSKKSGEPEMYYNVNIWSKEETKFRSEIQQLKEEIEKLKADLHQKELLIDALESQVKK